jgi:hypothetical protein
VQDIRNIFCLNIFLKKESFYRKVKIRSLIETVPLYLTRQRPGRNSRFRNLYIVKKTLILPLEKNHSFDDEVSDKFDCMSPQDHFRGT